MRFRSWKSGAASRFVALSFGAFRTTSFTAISRVVSGCSRSLTCTVGLDTGVPACRRPRRYAEHEHFRPSRGHSGNGGVVWEERLPISLSLRPTEPVLLAPSLISRLDERARRRAKPLLRQRRGAPQVHWRAGRRSPIGRLRRRARSLSRGKLRRSVQVHLLNAHSERLGARESFRVRPRGSGGNTSPNPPRIASAVLT
jgi:hypothetical protein